MQLRARVPERAQQRIAVLHAAELAARHTAAGDDHLVGGERFAFCFNGKTVLRAPERRDADACAQVDVILLREREAQHVQHAVGAVGQGIDAP